MAAKKGIGIKIAKIIGYPFFFFTCFIFFYYLTFPYNIIKDWAINKLASDFKVQLKIEDFEPSMVTGVSFEGIKWFSSDPEKKDQVLLDIEEFDARISLLPLLSGNYDLDFSGKLGGGEIEGNILAKEKTNSIKAEIKDINFIYFKMLKELAGLPIFGKIGANINLIVEGKSPDKAKGRITINVKEGAVGEGSIKGFTIPKIALTDIKGVIELDRGRAKLKGIEVSSKDLDAKLDGSIMLSKNIKRSSVRGSLSFKPTEEFLKTNSKFATAFQLLGLRKTGKDGYYKITIWGTLDGIRVRAVK